MCAAFQHTHHFVSPLQENQFVQFVYKPRYALNSHRSQDHRLGRKGENTHASKENWGKSHPLRKGTGTFPYVSMPNSSPEAVQRRVGGGAHARPVSKRYVRTRCVRGARSFGEGQTLLFFITPLHHHQSSCEHYQCKIVI